MTLLVARRWLGYSVWLNRHLPVAEEIIDRFEACDIPLTNTFESDENPPILPEPFIVSFDQAVEPARLAELLAMLEGVGVRYLFAVGRTSHKDITIGALNLEHESVTPLTDDVVAKLSEPALGTEELHEWVRSRALPALEYRLTRR